MYKVIIGFKCPTCKKKTKIEEIAEVIRTAICKSISVEIEKERVDVVDYKDNEAFEESEFELCHYQCNNCGYVICKQESELANLAHSKPELFVFEDY